MERSSWRRCISSLLVGLALAANVGSASATQGSKAESLVRVCFAGAPLLRVHAGCEWSLGGGRCICPGTNPCAPAQEDGDFTRPEGQEASPTDDYMQTVRSINERSSAEGIRRLNQQVERLRPAGECGQRRRACTRTACVTPSVPSPLPQP